MKYFTIMICIIFIGCNYTAREREDMTLQSGKRSDTVYGDYYFGMSKWYAEDHTQMLKGKNEVAEINYKYYSVFETNDYRIMALLNKYFYNDSLFRITYTVNEVSEKHKTQKSFKEELIDTFIKYHGSPYKNGTQPLSKIYWLKNNKRIDFIDTMDNVIICYSDISRERRIENDMQNRKMAEIEKRQSMTVEYRVAEDVVKEYWIAARQGDKMQMCAQAGMCAAAFLQAQDEQEYDRWKGIEDSLTRSLGMRVYR